MEIMIDGPTLVLSGDFDVRSTGRYATRSTTISPRDEGAVVLDVSGVEHRRPHGAEGARRRHPVRPADGQPIILQGACPAVRRMLHLSHLIRFSRWRTRPRHRLSR